MAIDLFINKVIGGAGDLAIDSKPTDYKDNLYLAVNGEWQEKAKIPSDKSSAGASVDLELGVEKDLMKEFHDFSEDESKLNDDLMLQAVKLYRVAKNVEGLHKFGGQPILKDIERVNKLNSLKELSADLAALSKNNYFLPINSYVETDMKDTEHNVVNIIGPDLILSGQSYYEDDNESGKKLLAKYAEVAEKLLVMLGYTTDEAKATANKALAFDKSLVPIVKTPEEWADDVKIYNPMTFADFVAKSTNLDLKKFVVDQVNDTPEKIIVNEPRYLDNLDKLVNDDTFENIKAWIIVRFLMDNAEFLDEDFRQVVGEYKLARSGAEELESRTKYAYHLSERTFSEVVGTYYGKKYFGEKAKADVRSMIEKMIAIYKQRLTSNTWLSEATKEKAVVKLNKIVLKVGYPDKIEELYKLYKVDESKSLYENVSEINKVSTQYMLDDYHKPVDRTRWLMPGHMVNACYDPTRNDVTFPAAILQAPFYSLKQTASENFGGIGATIAHEVSHAFDNNGAQFDEYGNINNWWTKEDYAKFNELTQDMIDQFNGIKYAGKKVNGKLVVSENIADIGGLRCAIEAAKLEPDYNAKEYFIQWAKSWRYKATSQYDERLLATDVHAPQPLRANVMSQDMDEFFDAFGVTDKDGMWLDPSERINIW